MTTLTEGPRNGEFLASEANGGRARDVVALKAGAKYLTGSVLEAELVGETPTGYHVMASDTAAAAVVLYETIDATAAAVDATVISRDAEVIGMLLVLKTGTTLAEATAILAKSGIIVR